MSLQLVYTYDGELVTSKGNATFSLDLHDDAEILVPSWPADSRVQEPAVSISVCKHASTLFAFM